MKNKVTVQFFPALNGDSFLISYNKSNMLVDGGYVNTYRNFILPELEILKQKEEDLDLVVVTHIDEDHISGINKFLVENNSSKQFVVKNIWHNSYRHLQRNEAEENKYKSTVLKKVKEMKINPTLKEEPAEPDKQISAKQGSTLAKLIRLGEYPWNSQFKGEAVIFQKEEIEVGAFKLKMLSPNQSKLEKLQNYWLKELYKMGYVNDATSTDFLDDAFEFMVAKEKATKIMVNKDISSGKLDLEKLVAEEFSEDTAAANGSSISFVLQCDTVRMLFLGDSHPSVIIESLQQHYSEEEFPIIFDMIKVAHHASALNSNNELLELIDSEKFLISTNGKSYDHPDVECIARIVTRPTKFTRNLYFNYNLDIISEIDAPELKKKYNYECTNSMGTTTIISLDGKNY